MIKGKNVTGANASELGSDPRRSRLGPAFLLFGLALVGCDGGTSPADRVVGVSVDMAAAPAGAIIGQPIEITIQIQMDPAGSSAEGIEILLEGPGSFRAPGSADFEAGSTRFLSGPNGRTPVGWIPDRVGTARLSLRAARVSSETVITVLPDGGRSVLVTGPESGTAGEAMVFQVEVFDALGRPFGGEETVALAYRVEGQIRLEDTRSWNGDVVTVDVLPEDAGSVEMMARVVGTGAIGSATLEVAPSSPHSAAWLDEPPFGRSGDSAQGLGQFRLEDPFGNMARGTFPVRASNGGEVSADSVKVEGGLGSIESWQFGSESGVQWIEVGGSPGTWLRLEATVDERKSVASIELETPERMFPDLESEVQFTFLSDGGAGSPFAEAEVLIDHGGTELLRTGRTDREGRFLARWTPESEGVVEIRARGDGGTWSTFSSEVLEPPRPTLIEPQFEGQLSGYENEAMKNEIRVQVRDQYGEGTRAEIEIVGQGDFAPGSGSTDLEGWFSFLWTPGSGVGKQTAELRAGDAVLEIEAQVAPERGVDLLGAYLVQQVQTPDHAVRLVAGRPATLRLFPQRLRDGEIQAVLSVMNGGGVVREIVVPSHDMQFQPTGTLDESNPNWSINLPIHADEVAPGLRIGGHLVWGSQQMPVSVDPLVTVTNDVQVVFVPIRTSVNNLVGDASETSVSDHMGRVEELPFNLTDYSVRDVHVFDGEPPERDGRGWGPLIGEIRELRTQDGSSAIYYGLFEAPWTGGGIAGVGYVGTPVSLGRSNIGPGSRAYIFTHEVGHNLGRWHAPCGSARGTDPAYPFEDGRIGAWGWLNGQTVPPTRPDVMGYCGGRGFGPHNWNGSLAASWLGSRNFVSLGEEGPVLRVFGTLESGNLDVVAYAGRADRGEGPAPASVRGTALVEVFGPDGRLVSSRAAALEALSHGQGLNFATEFSLEQLEGQAEDGLVRVTAQGVHGETIVREIKLGSADGSAIQFQLEVHGPLPIRKADGTLIGFARNPESVPPEAFVQPPGFRIQGARMESGRLEPIGLFWP